MNILITGGASGIGAAITKKLAASSQNKVFFTFNKSVKQALAIEKDFSNTNGVKCDFKQPGDLENLLQRIPSLDLDMLVNNAITSFVEKQFHKMNPQVFLDGFQSNVLTTIQITQQSLIHFRKKKFGKIVTVLSSYLVNRPPVGLSEYVASKAYLNSLSKSWAVENAGFNITSNCIAPSLVKTNFTSNIDERFLEQMVDHHPLKRLLTVEEIADTVAFFASSTQHINGISLVLNSGTDVI